MPHWGLTAEACTSEGPSVAPSQGAGLRAVRARHGLLRGMPGSPGSILKANSNRRVRDPGAGSAKRPVVGEAGRQAALCLRHRHILQTLPRSFPPALLSHLDPPLGICTALAAFLCLHRVCGMEPARPSPGSRGQRSRRSLLQRAPWHPHGCDFTPPPEAPSQASPEHTPAPFARDSSTSLLARSPSRTLPMVGTVQAL